MHRTILSTYVLLAALLSGCLKSDSGAGTAGDGGLQRPPAGFPVVAYPADNPYSPAKAELGRYLFYDNRFSRDSSVACGTCHKQEHAFADAGAVLSKGFHGLTGTRNTPGLTNVGYNTSFFWDGTVLSLEKQAIAPIINPVEMNMNTDTLVLRLRSDATYTPLFLNAWGTPEITFERVTRSLATFQRTLVSGNTPFDRWNRGDAGALSLSAQRGYDLFFGEKGDCFHCHGSFNFTDNMFHNNGTESAIADEGRYRLTNDPMDRGRFRSPTLRNITLTAPYMHDGKFTTLDEVVDHYNAGGKYSTTRDILIRPLGLTAQERKDIIAFLHSLTDSTFITDPNLSDPWKH